ncbi:MAG TPA: radical SAM protein, partial [Chloroflexota bacterium]|nr:radical SAM protein [Chloroflexota bacterium]
MDLNLSEQLQTWGEPAFRRRQVAEWKYRHLVRGYAEMRNLPLPLRQRLEREVPFSTLKPIHELASADGRTTKLLLQLRDGQLVESVLMRSYADGELQAASLRNTVCVSSQAGCKMRCSFCATGHGGWRRDLQAEEIVDQVLHFARMLKDEQRHVTNVVFMGMGEPL